MRHLRFRTFQITTAGNNSDSGYHIAVERSFARVRGTGGLRRPQVLPPALNWPVACRMTAPWAAPATSAETSIRQPAAASAFRIRGSKIASMGCRLCPSAGPGVLSRFGDFACPADGQGAACDVYQRTDADFPVPISATGVSREYPLPIHESCTRTLAGS